MIKEKCRLFSSGEESPWLRYPTLTLVTFPDAEDQRDLVLKNFDPEGKSPFVCGTKIRKQNVRSITFLDSLETAPENAADVSETGNRKVLLWAERGNLYIAGDGKVFFPADSRHLFGDQSASYANLREIDFHDVADTSHVTNMNSMFSDCRSLTALDLRSFDTGNVTDMSDMFFFCRSLTSLNVSSFDTENVEDMSLMFTSCNSLTSLDLSSFNTGNAENVAFMFLGCRFDLNLVFHDSRLQWEWTEDIR